MSALTRQDCINIVKEVLGDSIKVSLERSESRVKKLEEALGRGGPNLAGLRSAWTRGIDDPTGGPPLHMRTTRIVTGTKKDEATGRQVPIVETREESPEQFIDRMMNRGQSRMFGTGMGRAPIKDTRAVHAVRFMRMMVLSGHDFDKALMLARSWEDQEMPAILEQARDLVADLAGSNGESKRDYAMRALGTNVLASGGSLVPPEYSQEILDILHAKVVVLNMGAMALPLEGGQIVQPFLDTGATVGYTGENDAVNATEPTTGELVLTGHELQAVVPMSNKLMASASVQVDAMIRNHLVMQFKKRMDLSCIRGDGTVNTPRGLNYWVNQAGVSAAHRITRAKAGASSTIDEITGDLTKALAAVEGENLPMDSGGWVMSVRDKYGLFRRRGADGHLVFEPEMRAGVLWGFPFGATTQVPITLGSGDKSEVYFADFSTCVHAERGSIEVEAVRNAAYNDASGTIQSGLSRRQTVVSATAEHDFGCLYRGKEVSKIDTVDWGV